MTTNPPDVAAELPPTAPPTQTPNGDTGDSWTVNGEAVVGLGNFHKSLPHNEYGEVREPAFRSLEQAILINDFSGVHRGAGASTAPLINPLAGLADDRLISPPRCYTMPAAPKVMSDTTAAEMVELYWMALLRDVPFNDFEQDERVAAAVTDVNAAFARVVDVGGTDSSRLQVGVDVPGSAGQFTPHNLFRLGLPGEEAGPMVSQFFVRPAPFGTQTIDMRQRPYLAKVDYLTKFGEWLDAQNSGRDQWGQAYGQSNEDDARFYEAAPRYICTMRDLARFVNKDALHQAYFNAALLLLAGGAKWTPGNRYHDDMQRDAGFGVLGGPHILALVSEVATRALKAVWYQKWQTHLRLRPEAYGGLAHVQHIGVTRAGEAAATKRPYGLPAWLFETEAAKRIQQCHDGLLLPLAFSAGSPTHPAYGAGHATVAGACVTVLKAFFQLTEKDWKTGEEKLIPFARLLESDLPYGVKAPMRAYLTGLKDDAWGRIDLGRHASGQLTIEGELNKLAQNVAMGRSMGGVHWRTDNARSLMLGEALAAHILRDIVQDVAEKDKPIFTFRTFARSAAGLPRTVVIDRTGVKVDNTPKTGDFSAL